VLSRRISIADALLNRCGIRICSEPSPSGRNCCNAPRITAAADVEESLSGPGVVVGTRPSWGRADGWAVSTR